MPAYGYNEGFDVAARELKSADEIRAEVNRIANAMVAAAGKVADVSVGHARRHSEPDTSGCNWSLEFLGTRHPTEVGAALRAVKRMWNMRD
jgi:hypothetical protein